MADIVLKDVNGNPTTHRGITELKVPSPDGSFNIFGSSGFMSETVKCNSGEIRANAASMVIEHGLGVVPDFIFIGRLDTNDIVDRNRGFINWAYGWSRRMVDIQDFANYAVRHAVCIEEPNSESNVNDGFYFAFENSIDEHLENAGYGQIHRADSTSFHVGRSDSGDFYALHAGQNYRWIAIGGLGVRMNETGGA